MCIKPNNLTGPCVCLSVGLPDVTSSVPDRLIFGGILIAVLVYKQAMSVLHKQLNQADCWLLQSNGWVTDLCCRQCA